MPTGLVTLTLTIWPLSHKFGQSTQKWQSITIARQRNTFGLKEFMDVMAVATRYVKLKWTLPLQPRPPWDFRDTLPRTILTNLTQKVVVRVGADAFVTGRMDPLLRLYQQTGYLTKGPFKKVDGIEYVVYLPEEWDAIGQWADWIEVVHGDKIWRISKREARMGYQSRTGGVPLSLFERAEFVYHARNNFDRLGDDEALGFLAAYVVPRSFALSE